MTLCECGCGQPAPIAKQTRSNRGFVAGQPQRFIRGHSGAPKRKLHDVFMQHFAPGKSDECWDWQGPRFVTGYGRINLRGEYLLAHRVSYQIHKGKIAKDLEICHKCDRPICVNPEHLFEGTHQQNMDDMWAKGRVRVGEDRKDARLTNDIVKEIRRMASEGIIQAEIARKFNLDQGHIYQIIKRKIWKHIPEEKNNA